MNKKAQEPTVIILILLALAIIVIAALRFGNLLSLVGIGQSYSLNTEDATITFFPSNKYYVQTGCKGEPNLGACSSRLVETGKDGTCSLMKAYVTGFYDCDSAGYSNNCEYGLECSTSSTRGKSCDNHCLWGEQLLPSTYGGATYQDIDDCSFYLKVEDGAFSKEFSGAKEKYYRDFSQYTYKGTSISFVSSDYGVAQRRNDGSSVKDCLSIKFRVTDSKYIYDVCLGNDGIYGPQCSDVLTKTCRLSCGAGTQLDPESCTCSSILFPEAKTDTGFSYWFNKFLFWIRSLFS